jgi:hypothetical protein
MGALSTYAADSLMDLTLRDDAFSSPAGVYLTWFTTPPSPDGSAVEVTGGGYAREAISFDPAADGNIVSDSDVEWATLHTTADQMLCGWGIFDASTAGNLLAFGATPSFVIPAAGHLLVPAGQITVSSNDAHMTDWLANKWLDHLFRNVAYVPTGNVYLGLYAATPTATTGGTEVTGGGYARQLTTWSIAENGTSALDADLSWDPVHTTTAQTLTGLALSDAVTAGNRLFFGTWPTTVTVPVNDPLVLNANSVAFRAA